MKCLIVEDDALVRLDYVQAMSELKLECFEADSVETASYLLKIHDFDVVLLDMKLRGGDCIPIVDYLSVVNTHAVVVLITGSGSFPRGENFVVSPRIDYVLHKPVNLSDLCSVVEYSAS